MSLNVLSTRSKTIGILLFALGILSAIGLHYAEIEGEYYKLFAYASAVVGFALFVFGMLSSAATQVKKKTSIHQDDTTVAAMSLIRCMLAICIADGDVDDDEVKMIRKIYKQLMNTDMDEDTIRQAAEEMKSQEEIDIVAELKYVNSSLYSELRNKILKASLYILAADGKIDESEEEMLILVGKGLGFSKRSVNRAKNNFLSDRGLS